MEEDTGEPVERSNRLEEDKARAGNNRKLDP